MSNCSWNTLAQKSQLFIYFLSRPFFWFIWQCVCFLVVSIVMRPMLKNQFANVKQKRTKRNFCSVEKISITVEKNEYRFHFEVKRTKKKLFQLLLPNDYSGNFLLFCFGGQQIFWHCPNGIGWPNVWTNGWIKLFPIEYGPALLQFHLNRLILCFIIFNEKKMIHLEPFEN